MPRGSTRQGNSGSSSRNRGRHREENPFIHPSMEFLLNASQELLPPLPQDRRNSLGMSCGNNNEQPAIFISTPHDPRIVGSQWHMRTPPSPASAGSPIDGPSRTSSASYDSQGTNHPTSASDASDTMNDDQSEPSERGGLSLITPAGKDGFDPHTANRAVIDCIKKYYKKPMISYKEAPLDVREVWFSEFKKNYKWSPEHDTAPRYIYEDTKSVTKFTSS